MFGKPSVRFFCKAFSTVVVLLLGGGTELSDLLNSQLD